MLIRHGSYIVKWRPEDNYIVINNAMGFCVKYTRISKSHHAQTRSWRVSGSRLEALQSRMRSNISVCAATGLQPVMNNANMSNIHLGRKWKLEARTHTNIVLRVC